MSNVEKYLKATRDIFIKASKEDIEEKILKRISNVSEEDRKLIDEKFIEYMKRMNSRPYITAEWIMNNPVKLSLILLSSAVFAAAVYLIYRKTRQ